MITALYKSNALVGVDYEVKTAATGQNTFTSTIGIPIPQGGGAGITAKVFVWESINSMIPLK